MERWCNMTSRFWKALRFGGFQDYMGSKRRHNIHSWNVAHIGPATQLQWAFYCLGGTEAGYLEHQKFLKHLPVCWRQPKSHHSHRLDKEDPPLCFWSKIHPVQKGHQCPSFDHWPISKVHSAECSKVKAFKCCRKQPLPRSTPRSNAVLVAVGGDGFCESWCAK